LRFADAGDGRSAIKSFATLTPCASAQARMAGLKVYDDR